MYSMRDLLIKVIVLQPYNRQRLELYKDKHYYCIPFYSFL